MSKILYCIAQFTPKEGMFDALFEKLKSLEPDTLREEGCLRYRVTKHIENPFAPGESMPIVFRALLITLYAHNITSFCSGKALTCRTSRS